MGPVVKTLCLKCRVWLASLVAQMVKNLPAVQETQVQSLGWEDTLEKGMATHSSVISFFHHFLSFSLSSPGEGNDNSLQCHFFLGKTMDGGAWQATVHGVTKSQTGLSD